MSHDPMIFEFQMSRRLIFGWGESDRLVESLERLGGQRVLLVSDPGLSKTGLIERMKGQLENGGFQVTVFDEVEPDPQVRTAERARELGRAAHAELVIGLGGGSSLDIAKVSSVLLTNDGDPLDYAGIGLVPRPGLPTVLMPTTAGTGSEVTPIAVLSDKEEKLKKGIVSDNLYANVALVDPQLTQTVPPRVTAYTGIDALTHAIEAYTNRKANAFVDVYAEKAIQLIGSSLPKAVADRKDREARENMALGSLYGGLCLGSVNTAAVHAMAYPLGGEFNVPHGLANSLLLPHVISYSLSGNLAKYARVAELLGEETEGLGEREAAERAVAATKRLLESVSLTEGLASLGIGEEAIPGMAEGAMKVTRLMQNNPKTLTQEDCEAIYRAAM